MMCISQATDLVISDPGLFPLHRVRGGLVSLAIGEDSALTIRETTRRDTPLEPQRAGKRHLPTACRFSVTALCATAALLLCAGCVSTDATRAKPSTGHVTEQVKKKTVSRAKSAPKPAPTPDKRSESAIVYARAGDQFRIMGDFQNAAVNYRKALDLKPTLFEAKLGLVKTVHKQGDKKAAIELLRDLLASLRYQKRSRGIDRVKGDANELLRELDEVGLALADAARLLSERGLKAEKHKRRDNALELYDQALSIWPADAIAGERTKTLRTKKKPTQSNKPTKADLPDPYITLHTLTPSHVTIENGKVLKNTTKWGLPIYNQGVTYEHGLWAPAPSRITYALNGIFQRLTAKILISAFRGGKKQIDFLERELRKPKAGTVRFRVLGDGRTLFKSDTVRYGSGARNINVDVSGVRKLTIEATDADDGDLLDFAVWADARLYLR